MKSILITSMLFMICYFSNAQKSAISIGGNYNADITDHKLGKINYPSWELSYELSLGKKISINTTLNFAKRQYDYLNEYHFTNLLSQNTYLGSKTFVNYDQTIIIAARYYLNSFKSGIYFELGLPFTYTSERTTMTSGLSGQNNHNVYSYSISTIGGLGIDCSITKALGLELNLSVSPSLNFLDVDYGTSGFIKSGVRVYWVI